MSSYVENHNWRVSFQIRVAVSAYGEAPYPGQRLMHLDCEVEVQGFTETQESLPGARVYDVTVREL